MKLNENKSEPSGTKTKRNRAERNQTDTQQEQNKTEQHRPQHGMYCSKTTHNIQRDGNPQENERNETENTHTKAKQKQAKQRDIMRITHKSYVNTR